MATMTGRSWFETRKIPLTTNLKNRIRGLRSLAEKPGTEAARAAEFQAQAAALEKEVARREGDAAFHVEVKGIGSVEDPNLVDSIEAEETRAYELARLRARKTIREQAGELEITPDNVAVFASTDPAWVEAQKHLALRWIEAGLVNGTAEYRRLAELGGPSLLADAVMEVRAWQKVSRDQGEG